MTNFESFVCWIQHMRIRTRCAKVSGAIYFLQQARSLPRADTIAGIEDCEVWLRACHGKILKAHLRRAILTNRNTSVRTHNLDVGVADSGHAQKISRAVHKASKSGGIRDLASRSESHRGSDHVLLGDVHLKKASGTRFLEDLGVGGIFHVTVEHYDLGRNLSQCCQSFAERFAGRYF